MIGLHAPFRRATADDARAIAEINKGAGRITARSEAEPAIEDTIVGEDGTLFAVLAGRPAARDTWQIDVLAVAPERSFNEFGSRLLAIADALAADEGLATVRLVVDQATDHVLAVLDQEGFRPDGQGAVLSMIRPVVPQG
jgi:N-acetylglutamate synthase-like GNAT family acetyltransferase